jgi:hypothetical protein
MDDFLHNLRTGKNKPYDRNRKQFDNNGYKNPERQGVNDNRRKEPFQRAPAVDHFPAIKTILGDISEGQRRLAEIFERRVSAEERMASALEIIASGFLNKNSEFIPPSSQPPIASDSPVNPELIETESFLHAETSSAMSPDEIFSDINNTGTDRKNILDMIVAMRKEQMSYEKIARMLETQGIPTFSGKGAWHSQTVSKLCHQFYPALT